jgi:putative iron-regulated protein
MTVAYATRDQEEEHSCFSDSTWHDLYGNAKGIANVWRGSYEGEDLGPGLEDLYKEVDPTIATQVGRDLDEALTKMRQLTDNNATAPFDLVISEPDGSANRLLTLDVMKALKRVADGLKKGTDAMGISIRLEDPSQEL